MPHESPSAEAPSRLKYVWQVGAHSVSLSLVAAYSTLSCPPLTPYLTLRRRLPGKPISPSGLSSVNSSISPRQSLLFAPAAVTVKNFLSKPTVPPWWQFEPSFCVRAYLFPPSVKAAPDMRFATLPTVAPR